ncbi:MAG: IclR family transcriptional regulator, partial [Stackebrandtia sp.]
VLEFLAANEWSGVTDVGAKLGVHKSTAFRLLNTLESRGLVEQHVDSGKYRLGFGIVTLANSVTHGPDITRQAQSGCRWLSEQTEETVTLQILEDGEAVTIDQIMSTSTVASRSWLGRRTPLHCTSPGKVFLAHLPEDRKDEIIDGPLERYTDFTITDSRQLRTEIEQVRANGYATTVDEYEEGLSAAAAPVCAADGEVMAAIGLSGPSYRLDADQLRHLTPVICEAAQMASISDGYAQLDDGSTTQD